MRGVALAVVLFLHGLGALPGSQPARPVFKIRVLDATTNEPLAGVSVDFRCFDAYPRSTRFTETGSGRTDERGELTTILTEPAVCVAMNTLKPGFLMRMSENARPTVVGPGETVRVVHIVKTGRVDGHLLDESGRPIPSVAVHLAVSEAGRWAPMPRPSVTDEQGSFHFESVSTDRTYSVIVTNMTLLEPAPSIELRPGESRLVDLRARPSATARVSGRTVPPAGSSADVVVYLDRADSSASMQPATVTQVRADTMGRFTIPAVPRGAYRLRVDTGGPGSLPNRLGYSILWARQALSVDGDMDDVTLPLHHGPEVRGAVRFEGATPAPTTGRILLSLESADGPAGRITSGGMFEVDTGNRFSASGMLPGRYFLRVASSPNGWRLKDASTRGRDVASLPLVLDSEVVDDLVVTFTDRQSEVIGTVRTGQGAEDGEASVLVFPTDEQFWLETTALGRRLRSVVTDQHGKYGIPDLPPGDYFIAAVPTGEVTRGGRGADVFRDSSLLRQLSSVATRIRVDYDRPVTQDLMRVVIPTRSR